MKRIIVLVIFLVLLTIVLWFVRYEKSFSFFKNKDNALQVELNVLFSSIDAYYNSYSKYPSDFNSLIVFIKEDQDEGLIPNLEEYGVSFIRDTVSNFLYVYSFGPDREDNLLADTLSYYKSEFVPILNIKRHSYMLSNGDIYLGRREMYSYCDYTLRPHLYDKEGLIIRDMKFYMDVSKAINKSIYKIVSEMSDTLTHSGEIYIKGVYDNKDWQTTVICDQLKMVFDYRPMLDSMEVVFTNDLIKERVSSFCWPVTIGNTTN